MRISYIEYLHHPDGHFMAHLKLSPEEIFNITRINSVSEAAEVGFELKNQIEELCE